MASALHASGSVPPKHSFLGHRGATPCSYRLPDPVPHYFCFFRWDTPPFSPADLGVVVALIPSAGIKHPVSSISLCTAPSIWGHGYQFLPQALVHQGHDPHCVSSLFCHSQQLKEGHKNLPGPGAGALHSLHSEPPTQCGEGFHARAPADSHQWKSQPRGNGRMDNHLLKREMLRQLGAMAIHILSLISAVSLY